MKIIDGNLWSSNDPIILVTGNSYVNQRGELVMGRGAALELRNKYPYLASIFGSKIKHLEKYLVVSHKIKDKIYGVFQVKYHFKANADVGLIKNSALHLWKLLDTVWQDKTVSINFPGIGFGRLEFRDVLPVVEFLDNRITFYMKD